jgi:uroporphyrinogen decarboxylase
MLTSRERVLMTFRHEIPDRVPVDYHSNAGLDLRLKRHFGLKPNDHTGLRRALGVDFWMIARERPDHYRGPQRFEEVPGRVMDEWGIRRRWIEHATGGYWDFCDFPLREVPADDLPDWPVPSPDDYDFSGLAEECAAHDAFCLYTGHAGIADLINSTGMLRGMEQTLIDLVEEEEGFLAFLDQRIDIQVEILRRTIEEAKGNIAFLWMGEDLGTQIAPMISLKTYRKVLRPRHQRIVDLAREYDLPVMFHSCGSSSWAFDDFVEMGIHAVDTLQPEAARMAPAYLKENWGGRLAFHGCISTAGPVASGTCEETVRDARRILETMMPGGGFMFSPTHALQDNSPTQNVVALYEAAATIGRY